MLIIFILLLFLNSFHILRFSFSYLQVFGTAFVILPLVKCPSAVPLLIAGLIMYISYFILFAHLFNEMYLTKPQKQYQKPAVSATKKDQ
jgi:hypothetical protein